MQQQYVYGAALDIHSIMIAALLLAYPTSPSLTTRTYADSGSLKVQRYLDTISDRIEITRSTSEVKTKNSTDLNWGAAPRSKSVEFFVFTFTVGELLRCENAAFYIHAARFGIRSRMEVVETYIVVIRRWWIAGGPAFQFRAALRPSCFNLQYASKALLKLL